MWLLYQLAAAVALMVSAPVLMIRRGRHYGPTLRGRLALGAAGDGDRGRTWIHAVSVGEVQVAATLARSLPPELPLLVTTVTPTGQARAREAFRGRDAVVTYLPLDLGFAVGRFFRRFAPQALILVEGDYWPLVLRRARQDGVPVVVINGRVSDSTAGRWRLLRQRAPWLLRALGLPTVSRFAVQTEEDAERLRATGVAADRVAAVGNLKYETPAPTATPTLEASLVALAGGRSILVAGSTMQGEDEPVLDAFAQLGAARAMLVLVPRHPERWDEAERAIAARGLVGLRRSTLGPAGDGVPSEARPEVVLLDSMGELAGLYRIAHGAFIGGTLVPTGGHNPLEPARFGVPIVVGPSMDNFAEMAAVFDRAEAWRRVEDVTSLAACWADWLADPDAASALGARAAGVVDQGRGALERTRDFLAPALPGVWGGLG